MNSRPTRRRRGEPLKIAAVSIAAAMHPDAALARQPVAPLPAPPAAVPDGHQHVSVEVENPNDVPLHVWASRRHYDYDPDTKVLTLWLTEHVPPLPPGITMISDHPRTPAQVEVGAQGHAVIDVPVPHVIRRRVPGSGGLGMSFSEQRIGQIDRVDLHVQYADSPMPMPDGMDAAQHRQRLLDHGDVVHESITPNAASGAAPAR